MTPRHRRAAYALLALSALGLVTSLYLVFTHIQVRSAFATPGACDFDERFNCTAAALSPYADIGGVPVAGLGAAYYVGLIALIVMALTTAGVRAVIVPMLAGLTVAASIYSLFLLAVSLTMLSAICPGCSVTYLVNIASVALAVMWLTPNARANIDVAGKQAREAVVPLVTFALIMVLVTAFTSIWARSQIAVNLAAKHSDSPQKKLLSAAEINAIAHSAAAPSMGPVGAPVLIVVFSDFECPHCARFAATLRRLHRNYGDSLRVEYRSYPLPMHKNAELAARLGVCAEQQGKFWEFHNLAFEKQNDLSPDAMPEIMDDAGLDVRRALACADLPETQQAVKADVDAGDKLEINGTPAFVLNGELFVGVQTYDDLEARIGLLLQSSERAQLAP
jgi:protein-disulfide isomerase